MNITGQKSVGVGYWRTFETVARHLNLSVASDELKLSQSAVSRQIQSLEEEIGLTVFSRHSRGVELTAAGTQLYLKVPRLLEKIDASVWQVRNEFGSKSVRISARTSFACMWLINRIECFQNVHPEITVRIDTSDSREEFDFGDVDIAIRFASSIKLENTIATRLFGEKLIVVASPHFLRNNPPFNRTEDLLGYPLLEVSDSKRAKSLENQGWDRWFLMQNLSLFNPKYCQYFETIHQSIQAALCGKGLALAHASLVADSLANGHLVEVLENSRIDTSFSYWLVVSTRVAKRPEIAALCSWIMKEAAETRRSIGENL